MAQLLSNFGADLTGLRRGASCAAREKTPSFLQPIRVCRHALGGVDGFDEDEAESKGNDGAVVLGRLLAAQRHTLEALELADELFDAGAGAIERLREEGRPVLGR